MAKLTALTTIEHDGKPVGEGEVFTVTDDAQIAQLVASGAATVEARKARASKAQDDADAAAARVAADAQALAAATAKADADAQALAQAEAAVQAEADAAAAQAVLDSQANLSPAGE